MKWRPSWQAGHQGCLPHADGAHGADPEAFSAADALIAVDVDEGGFRRHIRFDIAADKAIVVGADLADFLDAGTWGHLNAPIAMDASIVIDAELVVAKVTTGGCHRNAGAGKTLFHFGVIPGAGREFGQGHRGWTL
jgi:hypothetical protein